MEVISPKQCPAEEGIRTCWEFYPRAGPEVIPVFLIELHGGKTKGTGGILEIETWPLEQSPIQGGKTRVLHPSWKKGNSPENAELLWSSSRVSTPMTMLPSKTAPKELSIFLWMISTVHSCKMVRNYIRSMISALLSLMVPPPSDLSQGLQPLCKDILTS